MVWKLAWASCDETSGRSIGWRRIYEQNPRVFVSQGDTPYCTGTTPGLFGFGSQPGFDATTTQESALLRYQQYWAKPTLAELMTRRATGMLAYWQPDDHEWANDNWDHTAEELGPTFSTQALINNHWNVARAAQDQLMAAEFDNPAPAAGNTDRPSGALQDGEDPPAINYPIRYFVRDISSNGNVSSGPTHTRIIFLDCISYRSPVTAADDASKRLLGAQQEAWFQEKLAEAVAAGVAFIFVSSTKKLWMSATQDNSDTLGAYATERDRLLAMIDATGARPIWLSGDRHTLHVMESRKAAGGVADMIDICACPIGVEVNGVGPLAQKIWSSPMRGYGLVTVEETAATVQIRHHASDSVLWQASFAPSSNLPMYPAAAKVVRFG